MAPDVHAGTVALPPRERGGNTMAQQGMRDRFRYTPGDGRVYTWSGGPWIKVYLIRFNRVGDRIEIEQPDVIAVPESTTGERLMAVVDQWRQGNHG
jgi:hypothetical protein